MPNNNIPFAFVLDYLFPLNVIVKPMFGFFALYVDDKIILVLRQRKDQPGKNGVWIGTYHQHIQSLKTDMPSLRSIDAESDKVGEWQMIPVDADDFEYCVIKACELIKNGDHRIGRIQIRNSKSKSKL
jgi:hypothetical protein